MSLILINIVISIRVTISIEPDLEWIDRIDQLDLLSIYKHIWVDRKTKQLEFRLEALKERICHPIRRTLSHSKQKIVEHFEELFAFYVHITNMNSGICTCVPCIPLNDRFRIAFNRSAPDGADWRIHLLNSLVSHLSLIVLWSAWAIAYTASAIK